MKYYDEEVMGALRRKMEEKVLRWPGVTTRKMFGCPYYLVDGKLFAWIVTDGVVLPRDAGTNGMLQSKGEAEPFKAGNKRASSRIRVPVGRVSDLERRVGHKKPMVYARKETKAGGGRRPKTAWPERRGDRRRGRDGRLFSRGSEGKREKEGRADGHRNQMSNT